MCIPWKSLIQLEVSLTLRPQGHPPTLLHMGVVTLRFPGIAWVEQGEVEDNFAELRQGRVLPESLVFAVAKDQLVVPLTLSDRLLGRFLGALRRVQPPLGAERPRVCAEQLRRVVHHVRGRLMGERGSRIRLHAVEELTGIDEQPS